MKKNILLLLFSLLCLGCTPSWHVASVNSKLIPVEATKLQKEGQRMQAQIAPYKAQLDNRLNQEIGMAKETMTAVAPESLLSNFCSDALLSYASAHDSMAVDIAVLNLGGLRKPIPKGSITIRTLYELMPFENQAVVIDLSGKNLLELLEQIAQKGGEPVAGVQLNIQKGKLTKGSINGHTLELTKNYRIATSDYLSDGNDKLLALKKHGRITPLNIKLRDVFISYIQDKTAKGELIQSTLDNRIYVEK